MRDAGRPDLDGFLQGNGRTPGWTVDSAGQRIVPLLPCRRCAEHLQRQIDFAAVDRILDEMPPGGVLRWDASAGRVLSS